MKFAFLQIGMTFYNNACLQALRERGHEVMNVFPTVQDNYDFDDRRFGPFDRTLRWNGKPDEAELRAAVDDFDPDVVVMVSWYLKEYRRVMRARRDTSLRVLVSTNIWENSRRQWAGRLAHRWYVDPLYDCVFVPGERSEWFARRLGFDGDTVIRGSNSADTTTFDRGARDRTELATARGFLFSGRLMPYKGVDTLAEGYRGYRDRVDDPWDLHVVGVGELAGLLEGIPGVHLHGFVEPERLSDLMHTTTALVLPSRIDFFGVVVHEAALSGQVLVCSDGVGAGPYLLQDGYNGWTVPAGHVPELSAALERVHHLDPERLAAMSEGSRGLAARFSPELWAAHVEGETGRRVRDRAAAR